MTPFVRLVITGAVCATACAAVLAGAGQTVVTQSGAPGPTLRPAPVTGTVVPRVGTGIVVGVVVDADGDRPLPGVVVTLSAGSGGAPATGGPTTKRTATDAQGRFVFHSLPAGRVTVNAQATGYVPAGAEQRRPGGPSAPIELADGERLGTVRVRMWKFAAIEGRVVDDRGDPLVRHTVRALKREWVGGGLRLTSTVSATTDDRGMFRVWGLVPGDYFVLAPSTQASVPLSVVAAYHGVIGQGLEDFMQTDIVRRLNGSNAPSGGSPGQVVGPHLLQTTRGTATSELPSTPAGKVAVNVTTYAPALDRDPLRLASGEERQGIELTVPREPASAVSGVATGPDGPVPHLGLRLVAAALGDAPAAFGLETASTVTDAQGAFTFLAVPAGEYTLSGVYTPRNTRGDAVTTVVASGGAMAVSSFAAAEDSGPAISEPTLFAAQPLSVGDRDVTGITVMIRHGLRLTGTIEFQGTTAVPAPELMPRFTVSLRPVVGTLIGVVNTGPADADRRFETIGYPAGRYFLTATSPVPAWTLASAMVGSRDISRTGVDLRDADIANVVLTFTDQQTELRGTTRTTSGTSDAAAVVLVFPADTRAWIEAGMNPRLRAAARTSATGAFVIGGLPPGDYRAVALTEDLALEQRDPAFIESIARMGTGFSLRTGEHRALDLRTEAPPKREPLPAPQVEGEEPGGAGPFVPVSQAQAPAPVRDAPAPMPTGTGVISGVLVTDEATPKPIRRATVQLMAAALRPGLSTNTDDEGRFVFLNLPEGRFTLAASKPPYVDAAYGATRHGRPGAPVALAAGARLTGLTIRMIRGAVIEGTVRDEHGRPAERAQVTLLRRQADRSLQMAPVGAMPLTSTDDRGRYRFYGLPPGEYTVGVTNRGNFGSDVTQTTAATMRWATDAMAASQGPLAPPPASRTVGSAPIYYPGVTDAADAGLITVTAGEERTGVDVATSLVPMARVQGRLVGPDGQPVRSAQVNILLEGPSVPTMTNPMFARPLADGTFTVVNMNPGRYVLVARAASGISPAQPGSPPRRIIDAPRAMDLFALHEFEVTGEDIVGMLVTLAPGLSVGGRVLFQSATPAPSEPPPRVSVRLGPAAVSGVTVGVTPATAGSDGTFALLGVAPGAYRVSASAQTRPGIPATWVMKSAVAGGVDVSDAVLTITPDAPAPEVIITMTDRVSDVSGLLTDVAGRPAPEYSILVFPVDKTQWAQGSRRRPPATRPATDGRYRLLALPPGDYYIVALTEIDPSEMYDPVFLESLIPAAQKFSIAEGEKKSLDFKIAGGQELSP